MDLLENNSNIDINYWYYRRKYNLIFDFLTQNPPVSSVCDLGAGHALFTKRLAQEFPSTLFYAVDSNYDDSWLEDRSIPNLQFSKNFITAEVVLVNDLLEHIEDSISFLRQVVAQSQLDTAFLVTVPAFTHLWSSHDVYLKHYRRYSRKSLRSTLVAAGLEVQQLQFLYWTIYPMVFLYRRLSLKKGSQLKPRPNVDFIASYLMKCEELLNIHFLPGVSIWSTCIKRVHET